MLERLKPGVYGLCNHLLNTPWPKVTRGIKLLNAATQGNVNHDSLQHLMQDRHQPEDNSLPDTKVGLELERMVAPMFISSDSYGTRSTTSLILDSNNSVSVMERNFLQGKQTDDEQLYSLILEKT